LIATQADAVQVSLALQTCPHLPQLLGSVAVATHFPEHADSPALHEIEHWLFTQSVVPPVTGGQTVPHFPQFSASTVTSTHCPPHAMSPVRQANPHIEALQVATLFAGAVQDILQAPQLVGSLRVSTHEPLQLVEPAAQLSVHLPCGQVSMAPHLVPHAPQFAASATRLTQVPAHALYPALQTMPH
jgi:hypothetical protein